MRAKLNLLMTAAASAMLLGTSAVMAQQESQDQAPSQGTMPAQPQATSNGATETRQVAEACLNQLAEFNNRMDQDGYWIAGWGSRWGAGPGAPAPATTPPPATPPDTAAAPTSDTDPAAPPAAMTGPWTGERWGVSSPRFQIRTLHEAATVLGHRGDQQGCEAVLAELNEVYGDYVSDLKEAGVDPRSVSTWRQERIVSAKPVTELETGPINIADITGTEIRNPQDEELGTIEDVVLDQQSGGISYVVVSRGGVLGIGEEFVPVPWKALKATPGLNTFVLNVPEQTMEQAPKVNPDRFAGPNQPERQQKIESFWQEHIAG